MANNADVGHCIDVSCLFVFLHVSTDDNTQSKKPTINRQNK